MTKIFWVMAATLYLVVTIPVMMVAALTSVILADAVKLIESSGNFLFRKIK